MPPKKTPNPVKKPRVVKVVSFENEEPPAQPSIAEKPETDAKTPKPLEEGAPKKPRKPRAKKSPNTLKQAREARKAAKAAVSKPEAPPVNFPSLTVDDIRKSNEESTRSMYEMIKQDMSKRFDSLREDLTKKFSSAAAPPAQAPKRRMNCPPIDTFSEHDTNEEVVVDFDEEYDDDDDDDETSFYPALESSFRDNAGDMALKILGRRR